MSVVRSVAHIDAVFQTARELFRLRAPSNKYKLCDILSRGTDEQLELEEINRVVYDLKAFLNAHHYCPYSPGDSGKFATGLYNLKDALRRYYLSDQMRIDHDKGKVFRKPEKKRKLEVYLDCKELRLYACQQYRDFVGWLVQFMRTNEMEKHARVHLLNRLQSSMRCEECGVGQAKHRRPGLIIEKLMNEMKN